MTTVHKSLGFAFLERYLLIGLQLVSFTLLARLLTPEEVGLYSVSMALISVAHVVRDFGLSNYLIQRTTLADESVGTALGVSLSLGSIMFVALNVGAPWVGAFYHNMRLPQIVHIISINFLIMPFNSNMVSLMRREMKFDRLMRINVVAAVISTATTIGLAWAGNGAASLAWGEVASNSVILAGALVAGGAHGMRRPRFKEWRAVLAFGGPVTAANIITSISMDISDLVVGRVLNLKLVAIASRAQGLMNLFHRDITGTIRTVAYPAYARAHREGRSLEEQYMASLTAITAVAWPFYGFIALFPLEVLRLMFGPQWDASAPLVPLFSLAGAFGALNSLIPTLMLAAGHSRLVSMTDLIIQPIKAIALSLVVYFYRDLMPFAIAFAIINGLAVPYFYAFKQACLPTDFALLARTTGRNLLLSALSLAPAAAAVLLLRAPGHALSLPQFLACAVATLVTWLGLLWTFRHPLYLELMAILRARFPSLVPLETTPQ